jgi:uncharacterized protein
MMAMRKCSLALSLLLLALSSFLLAERVQDLPKPTNYVSDFAGVLSPETQASLNALCAQVDRQAHAQIAVVTIKSLDGQPIENFATELEDKWKVGKKGTDRGLLLIFAPNDRKYRIEVGYGLEGILPDGRVGDIGRLMVPYLRQNNYDAAVTLAVREIAGVIAADAGVTLNTGPRRVAPPQPQPLTLGQVALLGIVLLVVVLLLARFGGSGLLGFLIGMFLGGGGGGGWGGRGGGGGFGGGDGGGFGGFGGGSSGGGGASGDW